MQGGLSCSALLDLIFPPVVGLHGTSHEGKEGWQDLVVGSGSSGPLWSWVTGLTQRLAFLSWCFASSFSAGGTRRHCGWLSVPQHYKRDRAIQGKNAPLLSSSI